MKLLKLIICAVLITSGSAISSQSFEGSLHFTKTIGPVKANYVYHVKDGIVRVEELDDKGAIQGIMLVNTTENNVVALSPEREMYIDVPNKRSTRMTDVEFEKTDITKDILGYTCKEWNIKNPADGRAVQYWVADDNFDFFIPMLKTLNRKDKMAIFFLKLPDSNGVFPMMGTETDKNGNILTQLEVTNIEAKELNDSLFEIPNSYEKFEREAKN